MNVLSGKNIIVTGGSRWIGRAIAESCASAGAKVAFNYLHSEKSAEELREKFPNQIELLKFDVGDQCTAKMAAQLSAASQSSIRAASQALSSANRGHLDAGFREEARLFADVFRSPERTEGLAAFFEKRPPKFR